MGSSADYNTTITPTIIEKPEWIARHERWYNNGAAITALILLLNAIAMAWASLFVESPRIITLMIISIIFCVLCASIARGKCLT
jgi:polyferredoxin